MGPMLAALSIHYIREVVPRPPALVPFPSTTPGLVGAIELRGSIIPVLDFGVVTGADPHAFDATIIMLLRVDDQVFGIFIHEICGVVELDAARQTPIAVAATVSPLVLSGFAQGERHGVVLDAARIAALPGLPMAQERRIAGVTAAQAGAPTLMFSAGGFHFGLPARFIEACVPQSLVAPSPIDDPLWIGMIAHNGRRIPAVDTLRLFGLGMQEPAREYACVVVRMPDGLLVALRIDNVGNILRIPASAQLPMQDFAIGQRHLLCGMHEAANLSLLIDGDALQVEPALTDLSRLEESDSAARRLKPGAAADSAAETTGSPLRNRPFLIVSVGGGRFAIPLAQVNEILPGAAKQKVALAAQGNGIVGMIAHRGSAVPLYDLAGHLGLYGRAADDDSTYILLASAGERSLGFLLDGLTAVERTAIQTLANAGANSGANSGSTSPASSAFQPGLPDQTIRTSDGATCSVLNLDSIIHEVAARG